MVSGSKFTVLVPKTSVNHAVKAYPPSGRGISTFLVILLAKLHGPIVRMQGAFLETV